MRLFTPFLAVALAMLCGCSSPAIESTDPLANYQNKFSGIRAPMPEIIHSRVERIDRSFAGHNLSPVNGEWEFEFVASAAWVEAVRSGFQPDTTGLPVRSNVPAWFKPTPGDFMILHRPFSSYSSAHLYIEKQPKDADHIRAFVCRH